MNLLNLKMEGPLSGEMSYIVIMQEGALDENEGTRVLGPVLPILWAHDLE